MKMYGDMKHYSKKDFSKNKIGKKQTSYSNSSLNTSKITMSRNKNNVGIDYFLNTDFKPPQYNITKKANKKKIKPK